MRTRTRRSPNASQKIEKSRLDKAKSVRTRAAGKARDVRDVPVAQRGAKAKARQLVSVGSGGTVTAAVTLAVGIPAVCLQIGAIVAKIMISGAMGDFLSTSLQLGAFLAILARS